MQTVEPEATLETAVEAMFEAECPALVVNEDDHPDGILTKTDVLESLTWEAGGNRAVLERQIRERKMHGKSEKPKSEAYWEKRFGWLLEGED